MPPIFMWRGMLLTLLTVSTDGMCLMTARAIVGWGERVPLSPPLRHLQRHCVPTAALQEEEDWPEDDGPLKQESEPASGAIFGTKDFLTDRRDTEEDEGLLSSGRALAAAALVGTLTGVAVALFKASIAATAAAVYNGDAVVMPWDERNLGGLYVLVPAVGGLAVAALRAASPGGMGPGLAEHLAEVERSVPVRPGASVVRGASAVATLGTGNALGPEGPSVELGIFISRLVSGFATGTYRFEAVQAPAPLVPFLPFRIAASDVRSAASLRARRQLLSAGAAAGVAAGFNAPLAGVFFALEVVSTAVRAA